MELESLSDALLVCTGYSLQQEKHFGYMCAARRTLRRMTNSQASPQFVFTTANNQAQRAPFFTFDKTSKVSARDLVELAG